jgi:hypothetical protein
VVTVPESASGDVAPVATTTAEGDPVFIHPTPEGPSN